MSNSSSLIFRSENDYQTKPKFQIFIEKKKNASREDYQRDSPDLRATQSAGLGGQSSKEWPRCLVCVCVNCSYTYVYSEELGLSVSTHLFDCKREISRMNWRRLERIVGIVDSVGEVKYIKGCKASSIIV